jgi:hypothetical protein
LAWAATKKRLIIIESVVGIHSAEQGVNYELVKSSDENQIAYAAFIDWFYNRVLRDDVPVPCNFTTPHEWKSVFAEQNMRLVQTSHFGQDIDIGPEYHGSRLFPVITDGAKRRHLLGNNLRGRASSGPPIYRLTPLN